MSLTTFQSLPIEFQNALSGENSKEGLIKFICKVNDEGLLKYINPRLIGETELLQQNYHAAKALHYFWKLTSY
jgi:hypothetical protein